MQVVDKQVPMYQVVLRYQVWELISVLYSSTHEFNEFIIKFIIELIVELIIEFIIEVIMLLNTSSKSYLNSLQWVRIWIHFNDSFQWLNSSLNSSRYWLGPEKEYEENLRIRMKSKLVRCLTPSIICWISCNILFFKRLIRQTFKWTKT